VPSDNGSDYDLLSGGKDGHYAFRPPRLRNSAIVDAGFGVITDGVSA
jgi:hypothetical protein